jgi:hypothetical protein
MTVMELNSNSNPSSSSCVNSYLGNQASNFNTMNVGEASTNGSAKLAMAHQNSSSIEKPPLCPSHQHQHHHEKSEISAYQIEVDDVINNIIEQQQQQMIRQRASDEDASHEYYPNGHGVNRKSSASGSATFIPASNLSLSSTGSSASSSHAHLYSPPPPPPSASGNARRRDSSKSSQCRPHAAPASFAAEATPAEQRRSSGNSITIRITAANSEDYTHQADTDLNDEDAESDGEDRDKAEDTTSTNSLSHDFAIHGGQQQQQQPKKKLRERKKLVRSLAQQQHHLQYQESEDQVEEEARDNPIV